MLAPSRKVRSREQHEIHVAIARGEILRCGRSARIHHRGVRLLQRLRLAPDVAGVKALAVEVEFLVVGPRPLEEFKPLGRIFVTIVVRPHLRAEHVELIFEPAAHYIEREPTAADVIDGRRHLRDHERVHQRYVAGGEHGDVFGQRAKCRGPSKALERRVVEIRRAAVPAPAPDWQQRLHAGAIDRLRNLDRVGPIEFPRFRHRCDGRAVAAVERHDAELHTIAAEQSRAGRHVSLVRSHGRHYSKGPLPGKGAGCAAAVSGRRKPS